MNRKKDREFIGRMDKKYRGREGYYLSLLQDVQKAYGRLPEDILKALCRELEIPVSNIYGVLSFYTQFHTGMRGKRLVRVCDGTACHVKEADEVIRAIGDYLGIEPGGTSADYGFTLEVVPCLGCCFLSPVMMVDSSYFGSLTPGKAVKILKGYKS